MPPWPFCPRFWDHFIPAFHAVPYLFRHMTLYNFTWKFNTMVHHTATAFPFIYSFSGNFAASAPISTFMCLWAIYIFPGSVHIFPPAEKADPSWEYIICLQTHECGNWDWGPDIPFLGIFVSNFRHFVFAVHLLTILLICSWHIRIVIAWDNLWYKPANHL